MVLISRKTGNLQLGAKILWALKSGLQIVLLSTACVFILMGIIYLPGRMSAGSAVGSVETLSTVDFVTIVLAAVAAILTALAIFLAVAGVIGYTQVKEGVAKAAESKAEEIASKRVDEIVPRIVLEAIEQMDNKSRIGADAIAESQSKTIGEGQAQCLQP
jgi:hypothetical protein